MPSEFPPVLVIKVRSTIAIASELRELRRCFNVSTLNTPPEELLEVGEVALDRIRRELALGRVRSKPHDEVAQYGCIDFCQPLVLEELSRTLEEVNTESD